MVVVWRRRLGMLVGVLWCAAILIASCGDNDSEPAASTTAPESGASSAEGPLEVESLVWSRVDLDDAVFPPGSSVNDIVAGGPGLVAVGATYHADADEGVEYATIWTSADGLAWSQVRYDENVFGVDVEINGVTVGGPGLVAVGGTSVWTSDDGVSWSQVPDLDLDPIYDDMRGVIAGGPGLVAFGQTNGEAAVWTSADGLTWSRVADDKGVFEASRLHAVSEGGPGLVAVGVSETTFPEVVPVIWTSGDGAEWSRVPHDGTVFGPPGDLYIWDVIAADTGLVAVGYGPVSETDDSMNGIVWTSPDGVAWSRVPHDEAVFGGDRGEGMLSVAEFDGGLVAVGSRFGPVIWASPDGDNWSRMPYDSASLGEALGMGKVVAGGPGLVVLGGADEGPALWVAAQQE
mgnify:CR=1 FL=1